MTTSTPSTTISSETQPSMSDALARLWTRFLPEIQNRMNLVETAVRGSQDLDLGDASSTESFLPVRDAGYQAAHKLAGILGTFGLHRGTELARRLELWLENSADQENANEAMAWALELREILQRP